MTAPINPKESIAPTQADELEAVPTHQTIEYSNAAERTTTAALESHYHTSIKTYLVLLVMGFAWGTCTLANVGPATTFSYAVADIGGVEVESWIPNAGLFPLIGLQPVWV